MKNFFVNILSLIIYSFYRVGMLPYFTDTIMTFNYFSMYATKQDFAKFGSSWFIFGSWYFLGFWWMLILVASILILNVLIYFIWKWLKKAKVSEQH